MPLGSTRYPPARVVLNLVRSLLNDATVAAAQVPITQITRAGGIVFVTTQGAHGLVVGAVPDQVIISQVPTTNSQFNGTFVVTAVTDAYNFQYNQAGIADTQLSGFSAGVNLGAVFTDPYLIPYVNSAYRGVRRGLAMSGMPMFVQDETLLTVPAMLAVDPSVQVSITDSTAPPNQLPVDLLEPMDLWERLSGSSDDFMPMTNLTNHGGIMSLPQGSVLGVWEWRTDGIYFPGALNTQQIRLRYKRLLTDIVDGTSPILIPDAQDCIAFMAAAEAAMARGSPLAEKWSAAGEDGLEKLIAASTRAQQASIYRRKPNSSRTGGFGNQFTGRAGW